MTVSVAAKSTLKPSFLYTPELKNPDDTFFFGRMLAGKENKTVIITKKQGERTVPIMEFSPNGQYSEIFTPPLKANMAAMLVEKVIEKTDMARKINKGEQEGVVQMVGLLKYFELSGGRLH